MTNMDDDVAYDIMKRAYLSIADDFQAIAEKSVALDKQVAKLLELNKRQAAVIQVTHRKVTFLRSCLRQITSGNLASEEIATLCREALDN